MKNFEPYEEASGRKWPRKAVSKHSRVLDITASHRALGLSLVDEEALSSPTNCPFCGREVNPFPLPIGQEERIKTL